MKRTPRLHLVVLALCVGASARSDDWPQWRGPGRDGVWRESGVLQAFPQRGLNVLWRASIGNGYSGPTVAAGRVFVTDRIKEPNEVERVLCFSADDGTRLWSHSYECTYKNVAYPDGPRAAVTIDADRAYALGTMGHLKCLDVGTGRLLWEKTPGVDYTIATPTWGIASAPLVEGDVLVVQIGARPNACIVGLDKRTGEERWRALADKASYSAPIVIEQAGKRVVVCWTGDRIAGLDAASGELYWSHPTPPMKMVINVPTPVLAGDRVFLTSFYDGAYMLELSSDQPTVEQVWRRIGKSERQTDALHCMMSTPLFRGQYIYGVDSYGELRCLRADTGERVWEDRSAVPSNRWANIHMVENEDRVWMFNETGELIVGRLSPEGFDEIDRTRLIEPTTGQLSRSGQGVCWSHPAYAYRRVFARSDRELVCADLAAETDAE